MEKLTPYETEKKRLEYKPDEIKVLFIGESPPSGGKFFFLNESDLYKNTRDCFLKVFNGQFEECDFLRYFKSLGCYLDDLCFEPVDNLPSEIRKNICANSVDDLAIRIRQYKPLVIIVVIKRIEKEVNKAIEKSGVNLKPKFLPFPRYAWQQEKYKNELEEILFNLIKERVL